MSAGEAKLDACGGLCGAAILDYQTSSAAGSPF
jgi:hypothetical protein